MTVKTKSGNSFRIKVGLKGKHIVEATDHRLAQWMLGKTCSPPVVGERLIIEAADSYNDIILSRVIEISYP